MIQIDEHIFEMGWFNHQLDEHESPCDKHQFSKSVKFLDSRYSRLVTFNHKNLVDFYGKRREIYHTWIL